MSNIFTTWEDWLDLNHIQLIKIIPLLICGPKLPECELARAGGCAVIHRGLNTLESWGNLAESGICQGIEKAREVEKLNQLVISEYNFAGFIPSHETHNLTEFVKWADTKRSIKVPDALLRLIGITSAGGKYTPHINDEQTNVSTESSTEKNSEIEQDIKGWEATIPYLDNSTDIKAARLAIEKLRGKSHAEAFHCVRPGESLESITQFVSKQRKRAETIANKYNLKMPPWSSR